MILQGLLKNYGEERARIQTALDKLLGDKSLSANADFKRMASDLRSNLDKNHSLIMNKAKSPENAVQTFSSRDHIQKLNDYLSEENQKICLFNARLAEKEKTKTELKDKLWRLFRTIHQEAISQFDATAKEQQAERRTLNEKREELKKQENELHEKLKLYQGQTKNVEKSIQNINRRLSMFGLAGFALERHDIGDAERYFYHIIREDEVEGNVFEELSEGEKTLISFLYFVEICTGSTSTNETPLHSNRIIVIDDPISSLSLSLVFDVGTLIKEVFFPKGRYRQVYVLTHHLYFFRELLGYFKGEELSAERALFRILKKDKESMIVPMKKNDIKNDYEECWYYLKEARDGGGSKVLVANAMRNVLEKFFSFIHGQDVLTAALDSLCKKNGADLSYKTFYRYVNCESHSRAANYIDAEEFDTDKFFSIFENVFEETGHAEHFKAMMGIKKEDGVILLQPTGS